MRLLFNARREVAHPQAGGSEVFIDRVARGLSDRGHDVAVRSAGPFGDHAYDVIDGGGPLQQFTSWPASYLSHHRDVDLVVDVANGLTWYSPLVRRRGATICLVHHVHELQWAQWFSPPVAAAGRFLEREAMPRAYRRGLFVAVSPSTASSLAGIGVDPASIRVVPNGVEVPAQCRAESAEPMFLALSRLVPHKRYDLLLEAWERVRPVTGGRLVIAGEGPEAQRLADAGVPGVELVGRVDEAEKDRLMGEAWLFLHPAEVEGWGLVVMEAAARATPTVGFWSLGVRDSVVHGVTGLLADDLDGYVARWIELATDRDRRQGMGRAARERAFRFPWERSVDQLEEVATEAILRARPRQHRIVVPAVLDLREPARTAPSIRVVPDSASAGAVDVTVVLRTGPDDTTLRSRLAGWRDALSPAVAELVVVVEEGDAAASSAMVDGLLAGFERCRPASADAAVTCVPAAGSIVALVDARAAEDADDLLVAASDLARRLAFAPLAPFSLTEARADDAIAWHGSPCLALSTAAGAVDLAGLLGALGHFDLVVDDAGSGPTAIRHRWRDRHAGVAPAQIASG